MLAPRQTIQIAVRMSRLSQIQQPCRYYRHIIHALSTEKRQNTFFKMFTSGKHTIVLSQQRTKPSCLYKAYNTSQLKTVYNPKSCMQAFGAKNLLMSQINANRDKMRTLHFADPIKKTQWSLKVKALDEALIKRSHYTSAR